MKFFLYSFSFSLFIYLLGSASLLAQGPIINSSDLEAFYEVGKEVRNFTDSVEQSYDVGTLGGPNTWDFSMIESVFEFSQVSVDPDGTPFRDSFPDAPFCQLLEIEEEFDTITVAGETYVYLDITDTEALTLGSGITSSGLGFTSTIISKSVPPEIVARFPIQLGQEWTYEGQDISYTAFDTLIITDTTTLMETTTVDAYGTMKLPDGSSREALRLNTIRTTINPPLFPIPGFPADTTKDQSFTFIAKDGSAVSISSNADPDQVPDEGMVENALGSVTISSTASSLNEPGATIPGLTLLTPFPNPTSGDIQIQYELIESTRLNLRILDLQGRVLSDLFEGRNPPGKHILLFNANRLAPGQYYVQLRANGKSAVQPFRVVK